ncbi:MAG: Branched-chain amino acid dehydrogenase [deaminating](EC [uncultured Solirubrobacteraceae bacterium]|uniref:Branched-chain amino acid dehydrogenase [deaminating](EC) n=1 Tax=uncultured Solirubrobacteraceae bacterium TaxID=1162706 RepID=A0A6J4RRH0_9ACTN|nr:MAG: Branched-chain amino acid dehydrogenase [deaminating](EC [uncultured Solirubrobacteraceae bacterium]
MHSTARGPSLGGCRFWAYADARAAMRDALRLSEGMTWKSAVAGLPLGGGKGVIMSHPGEALSAARRRDALLDFGDTVALLGGSYVTAEDVGTSTADMTTIAERTPHVAGLAAADGGSGDPSPFTALGVLCSIEAALEQHTGSPRLGGRSVALIGLGHVGLPLARALTAAGAEVLVADIDPARQADAAALGARWVRAEEAMTAQVDVLCPCALGGILDHESVPALQAPIVAGAANNQLASAEVAGLLTARGVLWAPDFVANAGGIINIAAEFEPQGYDPDRAAARVREIGTTMRMILADAAAAGVTPLAAAMALARRRVAEGARATSS